MNTFWLDLRYGWRALRRAPAFTAVAVLTLALGIGANTAIFSVVNAVLLRPLPFPDPDRLALVLETNLPKGWRTFSVAPPNFVDWRAQNTVFEDMVASRRFSFDLAEGTEPERLAGARVSASFFDMAGVPPALGRGFLAEEDQPGAGNVVVLGHGLWQRRFGGRADILNQTVRLNGENYTVVGVAAPEFSLPGTTEVWAPAAFTAQQLANRGAHFTSVFARLKRGVTLEQARAEMTAIARRLEQQYPDTNTNWGVNVISLEEAAVGGVRTPLWMLLGAVGFVLLIACANVANLLLARATARHREIAVRAALGAGRGRLARLLVTEGLVLAVLGGALGLLLAYWGVDLLRAINPGTIPRAAGIGIDAWVLAFTAGISLFTGVLFGLAPALAAARMDLSEALKEGGRASTAGRGRQRLRNTLVVGEVALAVVLLVGSGLLLQSFARLLGVDPGFQTGDRLLARLVLPQARYPEPARQAAFFSQLLERLENMPGVAAAALTTSFPLGESNYIYSFQTEAMRSLAPGELPSAEYYSISPGYLRAMGIPLRAGRGFTAQDDAGAPRVCLINETFARRYFPGQDPVGQRLSMGVNSAVWSEIVGVVADVKNDSLTAAGAAQMYEPFQQQTWGGVTVVLHAQGAAARLAGPLRAAVRELDAELPVGGVRAAEDVLAAAVARPRFHSFLLGLFAALALVLAAVGLYGVLAYAVGQRTHEIGIRMALGAARGDIFRLVAGQGLLLVAAGLLLGLAGAAAMTRYLSTLLYGVTPTDPLTFAGVAVLLAAVAFAACYVPARRATRTDPLVALRYE